jgi:periplasmic protein TonB
MNTSAVNPNSAGSSPITAGMGVSHMGMNYRYQPKDPSKRYTGLIFVIALHAFLGYALISGLARKGLDIIKKPLEAVVIQEVIIPPPPPPPPPPPKKIEPPKEVPKEAPPPPFIPPPDVTPQVSTAPVIVAAPTPPPAPVVIAPPPPPAPPAPVAPPPAPKAPAKTDIAVACPTQVPPEMPRKALQDRTSGVVRAQALIKDGVVKDVTILSGPRVFHAAVRTAMLQYKCTADVAEVTAVQEFAFNIAD